MTTKPTVITDLTDRCIHWHTRGEHPACFRPRDNQGVLSKPDWYQECMRNKNVWYLDIESTNLDVEWGFIISIAIRRIGGPTFVHRISRKNVLDFSLDKELMEWTIKVLNQIRGGLLVTYYGTGFDLPSLRKRALHYSLDFPEYGAMNHLDMYYVVKAKLNLKHNSLDAVSRLLKHKEKTHLESDIWVMAGIGSEKDLQYIQDHNIIDVKLTENVHKALEPFFKATRKSI